jgi:hypothetical protein
MANEQRDTMLNRAWEGVEHTYQNVSDRASQVADRASHMSESATQCVKDAPFTASLVSFGAGVGLGLLIAQLLIPERRRHHWYDSYLGCDRARSMEDMAHRYLPDAITRRMGV